MLSIAFFWIGVVGVVVGTLLAFWEDKAPWAQTSEGKALARRRSMYSVLAQLLLLLVPGALGYFEVIQLTPAIASCLVLLLSIITVSVRGQFRRGVEAINRRLNEQAAHIPRERTPQEFPAH